MDKERLREYFIFLSTYNFKFNSEVDDCLLFCSNNQIGIRIIIYHQEINLEIAAIIDDVPYSDWNWITFSWIIEYLSNDPQFSINHFTSESDYEKKILFQSENLSNLLKNYISEIIEFFRSEGFEERYEKIKNYIFSRLKALKLI